MSEGLAILLIFVFGIGLVLGTLIGQYERSAPPTHEQMMQMMSVYCGEDGCK